MNNTHHSGHMGYLIKLLRFHLTEVQSHCHNMNTLVVIRLQPAHQNNCHHHQLHILAV